MDKKNLAETIEESIKNNDDIKRSYILKEKIIKSQINQAKSTQLCHFHYFTELAFYRKVSNTPIGEKILSLVYVPQSRNPYVNIFVHSNNSSVDNLFKQVSRSLSKYECTIEVNMPYEIEKNSRMSKELSSV